MIFHNIELEKILGYQFKNKRLLETALTHKTYAYEAPQPEEYNERLEFLGDSVLNLVIAERLYTSNKYFTEGELTRRRSNGVNNRFLAKMGKKLQLDEFILLGRGEVKQNSRHNPKIIANCLEAIIGAIYLDAGMDRVTKFIIDKMYIKDFEF